MSDNSGKRREVIRRKLNSLLSNAGLRGFTRIGSFIKGEFSPTGEVVHVATHSDPYFVVPTLQVRRPVTGELGLYSYMDYKDPGNKSGVVVVPVVNKQFVVTISQHRFLANDILPTEWPVEFPRGWVDNYEEAVLAMLYCEIPGLAKLTTANVHEFRRVSGTPRNVMEDSSTRRTFSRFFLVSFESSFSQDALDGFLRQTQKQAKGMHKKSIPGVHTIAEMRDLHVGGGLDDLHSIGAWSFARNWLEK